MNVLWRRRMMKQSGVGLLLAALVLLGYARVFAAVTISSFNAQAQSAAILITWTTASEISNVGFHVLRSTSSGGSYAPITASMIPSKCIGCVAGASYSLTDSAISPGQTYYYKLQSVDSHNSTQLFGPKSANISGSTATPTATPNATQTLIPPTATQPAAPTATFAPGTVAAPPSATNTRGATVAPNASPTLSAGIVVAPTPMPTRVAIWVGPTARPLPASGNPAPPTPGVAAGVAVKQAPPEIVEEQSAETAAPSGQSFNARGVIGIGISLFASLLLIGSIGLGAASLYFFLCAHLRR